MNTLTTTSKSLPALRELDDLAADSREALNASTAWAVPVHATAAEAETMLARLERNRPDTGKITALADRIERGLVPAANAEIGQHVAALLGSYPASTAPDPGVFGKMTVEEIKAVQPSRLALDSACRKLRRTLKWPPAIVEVLEALKDAEAAWRFRARKLRELPDIHARAVADARKARDRAARIDRDRSEQQPVEHAETPERQERREMGKGQ